MAKKVKRLFDQFHPEQYTLWLEPNKDSMSFKGTVTITGKKVGRPSNRITFHQKDLRITKASIIKNDKKAADKVEVDRVNTHGTYDEVRLHTKGMLYPGHYTITLNFSGRITVPMNGLYPSRFTLKKTKKMLLATQFESHHAREVFPCIDEPEAKATFDLSLTTPVGDTVISNTPIASSTIEKKLQTTTFETTPKMSTYLLAFVTGELGFQETKTKDGTIIRAYATPDNVAHTQFALDVAKHCLEFYNDYFGIPYPLKKCDMVALPDFAAGAMENWGCITYREQTLLVDPKHTSLSVKQYVAMVIAHELAHQWFGNLVTMRWWTDLWLNEGFASWIEFMAVDDMFPDWQMWTQFITDEQQAALRLDALDNTHPIEVPIKHPDEIRTIFDTISYAKGASVIHMLHQYLGAKLFREGLRYYLKQHAHSNTDTIDLWEALEVASEKPVKKFMHAWTAFGGYPVVHATIEEKTVTLKQERFLLNRAAHDKNDSLRWPVPLIANHQDVPEILSERSVSFSHDKANTLKLNYGQGGFYHVHYNASHTHRLAELVRRGKFAPLDRMGLLADSFEAAKAGYGATDDALDLLSAYTDEDNAAVWDVISASLGDIKAVMGTEELREAIKPYLRKLTEKQVKRLGWKAKKGESHFDSLLRPTVLGMASAGDNQAVVEHALKMFKAMHAPEDIPADLQGVGSRMELKNDSIDPDIRGVVYGTVSRHGDDKTFEKLQKLHHESTNSEEQQNLAAALTGFKQPHLIKKALAMITSDEVRVQDASHWIAYCFINYYARHHAWEWLQQQWGWLEKNLGSDMVFSRLPLYAARTDITPEFLAEYKKFFARHDSPALERSIKQGIEMIQWRSAWFKRDYLEILAFFKGHQEN